MNLGLGILFEDHNQTPTASLETLVEVTELLALQKEALYELDERYVAMANVEVIRDLVANGKRDVVKVLTGTDYSLEQLDTILSKDDSVRNSSEVVGAIAGAELVTAVYVLVKKIISAYLESTKRISRILEIEKTRLKGSKISDISVMSTRSATLLPYEDFVERAAILESIAKDWNSITQNNAKEKAEKLAISALKLGYKSRFLDALIGGVSRSFGASAKRVFALRGKPAGEKGWDAQKLMKAVPVIERLMNERFSDIVIKSKDQDIINELNRSELTWKQCNKVLMVVAHCYFQEVGEMGRSICKLMQGAKPL